MENRINSGNHSPNTVHGNTRAGNNNSTARNNTIKNNPVSATQTGKTRPRVLPRNSANTLPKVQNSQNDTLEREKAKNENRDAMHKAALAREKREKALKEERRQSAARRKQGFNKAVAYIVLVLIAFAVMSLIFCVAFFVNLTAHSKLDNSSYTLTLSDYDSEISIESGSIIAENGNRYVNFSQIAEFYGFAMVGSIDDMKYVIKGDESETISFTIGSDKAFINDVMVKMPGEAYYISGDLYIDEEFISNYINGFNIESKPEEKLFSLERIMQNQLDSDGKIADGKPPQYEAISFKLKAPAISTSIPENDTAVEMPTFEFNSDLSTYEEYMNPGSTTEFLTLVNSEHNLSEDYIPTGLSSLAVGSGMYLKEYAAKSFTALYKEATACGITGLTVIKAYVSYDELLKVYNDTVDQYTPLLGAEQARRYANAMASVPGKDEHQTGLTVDFAIANGAEFMSSTAYAWLCDNSYKFGYIQRYPLNKTEVTGHTANSNQFRYVGRYHAVRMHALGLSLDEYAEYLGL